MNCFNNCPQPTETTQIPGYDSTQDTCVTVCNPSPTMEEIYEALVKPQLVGELPLTGEFAGITLGVIKSGATYNHWFSGKFTADKTSTALAYLLADEDTDYMNQLTYYKGDVLSDFALAVGTASISLGFTMVGKISDIIATLPVPLYQMDGTTEVTPSDKIGIVYVDEGNAIKVGNPLGGNITLILG